MVEATLYAIERCLQPVFDVTSKRWLVRYVEYGEWTWISCKTQKEAYNFYLEKIEDLKSQYNSTTRSR